MIRGITGFPRNGKTLLCVLKMMDEWIYSERCVGCNMDGGELKLGLLNEVLHEELDRRKIQKTVDLDARLIMWPKEKTFQYYRYRSGGLILPEPPDSSLPLQEWYALMKKYFLPMNEREEWRIPISYFIVEAHDFFPSKDWQQIARPTKFYASKHAHLHDENIIESQFPMQIEPNYRNLIQEWHRMTNNYLLSFGPFQKRGCFQRDVFRGVPPPIGGHPIETVTFKMEEAWAKRVASVYETTGSLGIMGRGAESKGFNHKKKMPWWMLYVFGAAGAAALAAVVFMVPPMIGKALGGLVGGVSSGLTSKLAPEANKAEAVSPAETADVVSVKTSSSEAEDIQTVAIVSGVMMRGSSIFVAVPGKGWLGIVGTFGNDMLLLTDGSVVRRRDVVSGGGVGAAVVDTKAKADGV